MGRYDHLRYWDGDSWNTPWEVKVWNGSSWDSLGTNDSSSTKDGYYWTGSSWTRFTRDKTTHYGNKEWWVGQSGYGQMTSDTIAANVNQNAFDFDFCYCLKDYDNDKLVARYGEGDYGWQLLWLADGRIQWNTYWQNNTWASWSSNYIKSYNWARVNPWTGSTGTGSAVLWFYVEGEGVTETSINRSGRHEAWRNLTIGSWGMMYKDHIRIYGLHSSGGMRDNYVWINDFSTGGGGQSNAGLSLVGNHSVTQESWVTWE